MLASFPLQAAVTPQTILSDPVLGQTYKELLNIGMWYDILFIMELLEMCLALLQTTAHMRLTMACPAVGVIDERMLIILFLTIERCVTSVVAPCVTAPAKSALRLMFVYTFHFVELFQHGCRQLRVDSVWYPWLKLLPEKPQTPLFYR